MKVLYFSTDYTPHDYRFLSALAETGQDVFYLRLEHGTHQTEVRPVPAQIEQVLWAGGQGSFHWQDVPRLVIDLRRVIKNIQPDLIHAGPIQTCAFLAILSGFRPILTMSWGFDLMQDAGRNAWWKFVTRYVLRFSTYFTSDAEVTCQKAIAFGMNPERTVVFPWGVDLQHFRPQSAVIRRPPSFVLLCNRSWEPRYGVDLVTRAFVKVAKQCPEIQLLLLSGGSQADLLREILTSGGVMDSVHFGGQISQADLPRYYNMADLYLSASHVDGSSVSLLEAMACGIPALVSDIPANKEWVTDGVNGWLFPDGDADALAALILRVIEERKKLVKIGRAARLVAEKRADWKKNFALLLHAYRKTLSYSVEKGEYETE